MVFDFNTKFGFYFNVNSMLVFSWLTFVYVIQNILIFMLPF